MRAAFKQTKVRDTTLELVSYSQDVVEEYRKQDLRLTLRQLYYQLVTKNLITNEEKSYKRLGKAVSTGRLAGLLDWDAIEDRGRVPKRHPHWKNVRSIVESALHSYRLNRLKGQPTYVELWVEKEALAGVLEPLAERFHIVLMVNKGYSSQSAMYQAACRIDEACREQDKAGQEGRIVSNPVILYLGDFDPSGEDMVRDIGDRLNMFLEGYKIDEEEEPSTPYEHSSPTGWNIEYCRALQVEVQKIAITMDQIQLYNPPPNPAKISDSRAKAFIAEHGASSWEVDALPPSVLEQIVIDAVEEHLDMEMMREIIDREKEDKKLLREAANKIMSSY